MRLEMNFKREEAERELAEKLPMLKSNPQLKAMQRAVTTLEIESGDAVIHALEAQTPRDVIADQLIKLGLAVKLGSASVEVLEAGNEFGRSLLKQLPPTLN